MDLERIKARAAEIAERESKMLARNDTRIGSAAPAGRQEPCRAGVASNFQAGDPYPVYLEKGKGSSVWDVDGTEYKDFHGGFGVNVVGHAHPKIVEALKKAAEEAIHFAVTTPTTVALAEAICERFQLDQMRFVNSGHRGHDGRDPCGPRRHRPRQVVKMEGSYHGHHDSVLFSVVPEADVLGCASQTAASGKPGTRRSPPPRACRRRCGTRRSSCPSTTAARSKRRFGDNEGEVAAVILEPVMMNVGIIEPKAGYLQALRDACEKHGAVLIYDEVKCGGTIAYGGTTERYGVKPHLAAFAKAIGGGSTIGAFGGEADIMECVNKGAAQQGTFNGNPLSSAAGLAALTQVLSQGRVRLPRQARHDARRGLRPGDRRLRHPGPHGRPRRQGLRLLPDRAAHELPRLPGDPRRALLGLLPVDGEPRASS